MYAFSFSFPIIYPLAWTRSMFSNTFFFFRKRDSFIGAAIPHPRFAPKAAASGLAKPRFELLRVGFSLPYYTNNDNNKIYIYIVIYSGISTFTVGLCPGPGRDGGLKGGWDGFLLYFSKSNKKKIKKISCFEK